MAVTLSKIKALNKEAQDSQKSLIQAEAEKNELVKRLNGFKKDIDDLDIPKDKKLEFKDYIDDIVEGNGERPEVNPFQVFCLSCADKAEELYDQAKDILEGRDNDED